MTDPRPRILIVDDERLNVMMLDEILRDDYDTSVALNGEQALKRAFAAPPDLILLDIQMEAMDGYEVCRRLKEHPISRDTPVIFVTAMTDVDDECRGFELGAVDYITKPFRPAIVRMRVKTHLELKRQRDLLARMASSDGLTGLANRRHFEFFLEHEWRGAARRNTDLSLIFIDIDHFKSYNDHYGHSAGDDCLRQVADALASALPRTTDLVARYGGEEFVCVLPATTLDGAMVVAEKLRKGVLAKAIPHAKSNTCLNVSISLGVSTTRPREGLPKAAELVVAADRQLYVAKAAGRNRVACAHADAMTSEFIGTRHG